MKHLKILFVNCSYIALLFCSLVSANPNYGGLQPILNPALRIEKLEVNISLEQVYVTYLVSNNSNNDINQTFGALSPIAINVDNNQITVHNKQVAISQHYQDVSAILQNLNVPLDPMNAMHVIDASPNRDNIRSKLVGMKLLEKDQETPLWILKNYYYWIQTFPAHHTVTVIQTYKPTVTTKENLVAGKEGLINIPWNTVKRMYNLAVHWSWSQPLTAKQLQNVVEKNNPKFAASCPATKDYEPILGEKQTIQFKGNSLITKQVIYQFPIYEIHPTVVKTFTLKIKVPNDMYPLVCWGGEIKPQGKNLLVYEAHNYVPQQELIILYVENAASNEQ
jgi:hypothetical protein